MEMKLGMVNQRLVELQLPMLRASEATALKTKITRKFLLQLLERADSDVNAMAVLRKAISDIKEPVAEQMPPPPAEPPASDDSTPSASAPVTSLPTQAQPPRVGSPPRRAGAAATDGQSETAALTPGARPESTGQPGTAPEGRFTDFHVYGGKGALTFEAGLNRAGQPVVFIDAAKASGARRYDWAQKIRVMLTPDECLELLAVLLGLVPSALFRNHGPEKDKWIEVQHQGAQVFAKVGKAKDVCAVPIAAPDATRVTALVLSQVKKSLFNLDGMDVLSVVRQVFAPMHTAAADGGRRRTA